MATYTRLQFVATFADALRFAVVPGFATPALPQPLEYKV